MTDLEPLVREAVGKLLTDDELESLVIDTQPPPWDYREEFPVWLHLSVAGERFDLKLRDSEAPETPEQMVERIQSDLQDWIAESKFGWGQLRVPK